LFACKTTYDQTKQQTEVAITATRQMNAL